MKIKIPVLHVFLSIVFLLQTPPFFVTPSGHRLRGKLPWYDRPIGRVPNGTLAQKRGWVETTGLTGTSFFPVLKINWC
jgi:hypothetical protein